MDLVTPQLGLLVWPALSFLLLLLVLRKFAWKPILDSVNERDAQIRQALDAAKEARDAMVRLQADNQAQQLKERQSLIDMLTHELKNPLSTIRFSLESIKRSRITGEASDASVQHIAHSVDRMDTLIEHVAHSNQVETGLMDLI